MSRASARGVAAAALTASVLLSGAPAWAHAPDPTRTVRGSARIAPSGEVEVDLLVDQRLPRGAARLQRARFDVDRDGRLSDAEARLLGAEVAPLVLRGIALQQGAAPLVPRSQEATARVEGQDLVRVAVLLRFALPSLPQTRSPSRWRPMRRAALSPCASPWRRSVTRLPDRHCPRRSFAPATRPRPGPSRRVSVDLHGRVP